MTTNQDPGNVVDVVASVDVRHDAPAADDGFVGAAVKQQTPSADTVRANRNLIVAGESYKLKLKGVIDIPNASLPGAVKGDLIYIKSSDNSLRNGANAAVADSLVTGTVGANNAIRWTERDASRAVRVQLIDPAAASQALSVNTDGDDIFVSLATNGGSAITSTAAQVIAAVRAHDVASQLVTVANEGASNGTGVVAAVAQTALTGGSATGAGWQPLGRVHNLPGERGCATDKLRVNLDVKL